MRKSMLAGAIALSLLSPNVNGLSLGSMKVDSYLGEPLNISIDVNAIDEDEYSTLDISLASPEMFREAGIEYPDNARNMHLELGPYNNGQATILVKTAGSVSEPFVHLLLDISWSGGNILREYTALIDPTDYQVEPMTQAAAPATSLGVTKVASEPAEKTEEYLYRPVNEGDTLSAIAALYRPSDVSIQQAWMAFYMLNKEAFPDANLNKIDKGTRLRIPDEAEMKLMSRSDAIREVKKLSKPLVDAGSGKTKVAGTVSLPPATLVVGGSGPTAASQKSSGTGKMAATDPQPASMNDQKGYDQLASIVAELGAFTQTIKQEISDSRDRDILFKEELIAARGENRVLRERMERLEAQLNRMTQLLELQSNALQSLNTNVESGQAMQPGLALNQLEPLETVVTAPPPEIVVEESVTPEIQTEEPPKTYYEQLLDVAISDAPEEDKSYIEEVLGQSSTSIGQQDNNPVTAEMQAKAAAKKSASAQVPADQATATMLANVRASLGNLPDTPDGEASAPKPEVKIDTQDSAYIEALNDEDRTQIQKSEARIAQLQKELQAKIDAAEGANEATSAPVSPEKTAPVETRSDPQTPARVSAPKKTEDDGLIASLMSQAKSGFNALSTMLGGVSSDIWRLLGGIGAAIIGLMAILGLRRRKDGGHEKLKNESLTSTFAESEPDVADIATKSMQHEPEDVGDLEEELHGSSLFDLSDESFMASEAIQDDSSLFSMDDDNDDFDSLTEMDSAQFGQQTAATQTVDVDPVAEADVYLAYDRKEQAIEVLEQAISTNPNQSAVVIKLLGLYQASENIEGFTRLFESSAEHIEDDNDWNQIKAMAQDFVPGHEMLADDFDSSIPVLMDEVVSEKTDSKLSEAESEENTSGNLKLAMASDMDNLAELSDVAPADSKLDLEAVSSEDIALQDDEDTDESLNLSMGSDQDLKLEEDLDSAMEEVNQHEPDTALALAKAYIELGEEDIAKDFLLDVVNAGSAKLKSEAEEMLNSLS